MGDSTAGGGTRIIYGKKKSKKPWFIAAAVLLAALVGGGGFAQRFLSSQSSGVDIFADGVVDVAVVMKDLGISSTDRFFLDAVCRTTSSQLDPSLFTVVEVPNFVNVDLTELEGRGIEQVLSIKLVTQTRPEVGTVYFLDSEVINAGDGKTWAQLGLYEMAELGFETIEPASNHLSAAYSDRVAREINTGDKPEGG